MTELEATPLRVVGEVGENTPPGIDRLTCVPSVAATPFTCTWVCTATGVRTSKIPPVLVGVVIVS